MGKRCSPYIASLDEADMFERFVSKRYTELTAATDVAKASDAYLLAVDSYYSKLLEVPSLREPASGIRDGLLREALPFLDHTERKTKTITNRYSLNDLRMYLENHGK